MRKKVERRTSWLALGLVAALLLAACSSALTNKEETASPTPTQVPTATREAATATPEVATVAPTATVEEPTAASDEVEAPEGVTILTEDDRSSRLRALTSSWKTNWNRHTIRYDEILSGGPPRDGIPSIDDPQFVDQGEAADWLADNEPVIALEIDGDARAYPLQILTWHEIVNDSVGEVPVAVTFCPLCNSAITFDRRLNGEVYEFGTSGLLRNSDLIMYDRTTESLWQQLTGEAIVGDLAGTRLTFLSSAIVSFADFGAAFPQGVVLSRDTGYRRSYGTNPYGGYDTIGESPFLFTGEEDDRLPAMERVVTVSLGEVDVAYPLSLLSELGVINDSQAGRDLAVFHVPGTSSALDADNIAEGKDVGATGVFDPVLDGRVLTFRREGEQIVDEETGSVWNVLGQAVEGSQAGQSLTPIVHGDHFWFAWAAFKPDTIIYDASSDAGGEVEQVELQLPADFQIDVYQGEDLLGGREVSFSQLFHAGKPVVLNAWAGLCPSCRLEMPDFQAVYDEFDDEVLLFGLDVGPFVNLGTRDDGRALLRELGVTYPAGSTTETEVVRAYKVIGMPTTFFIKPNGEIHRQWTGLLTEKKLSELIGELIEVSS